MLRWNNLIKAERAEYRIGDLVKHVNSDACEPPVAFVSDDVVDLIGAAAWLAHTRTDGIVLPEERATTEVVDKLMKTGFEVRHPVKGRILRRRRKAHEMPGRISLLTSGTTGEPKIVEHSWETLFTMSRTKRLKPLNWLLTYQPGTYAWFQLMTLSLFASNQVLTVSGDRTPRTLVHMAIRNAVDAVSSTPTFWRIAMLQVGGGTLMEMKLKQVTLGGEYVDQRILDELRQLYPAARITHIYASSEAGACIVVNDGREGFPRSWLRTSHRNKRASPTQMRVQGGTLQLRSPHSALNRHGWIDTGDAVEIRGDRAVITGRADSSIVITGGLKISTHGVERQLLTHPDIVWCHVYGRPAPIVGELLSVDIVLRSRRREDTEKEMVAYCRTNDLPDYMIPRFWNFIDTIPYTSNLKAEIA